MKAYSSTKRRSRGAPRISLFPFLAVLICTMGAMVLLMFAVMRQARLHAAREAITKAVEQRADAKVERETLDWQIEQLKQSRQATEAQLAEMRLNLGHIEDHSRQLGERISQLQAAGKNLAGLGSVMTQRLVGTHEELDDVRKRIAHAERRLTEARQEALRRPRSYAIVPYVGPHGTRRRPIYLECRAEAVVLQPEGIAFPEGDFVGPMGGMANPLAAALRAVREHWLAQASFDPQQNGEPYPLLLIRPSGIAAYYAATEAVKSWGTDVGYEPISEDWRLSFPQPDPKLAQVVTRAVDLARREKQALIAAAPRHYRDAGTGGRSGSGWGMDDDEPGYESSQPGPPYGSRYRGGAGAGVGRVAGGPVAGSTSSGPQLPYANIPTNETGGGSGSTVASSGTGNGSRYGSGATGGTGGGSGSAVASSGTGNGLRYGSGATGGTGGGSGSAVASSGTGNAAGGGASGGSGLGGPTSDTSTGFSGTPYTNGVAGRSSGSSASGGVAVTGSGGGSNMTGASPATADGVGAAEATSASATAQASGQGKSVNNWDGYVVGRPARETPAPSASPAPSPEDLPLMAEAGPVGPPRPGEWTPSQDPPPYVRPDPKDKDDAKKRDEKKRKRERDEAHLADKRGQDWALRDVTKNAVGITRTIRVDCYPDRLVIVPDSRTESELVVPLDPSSTRSVNRFVSTVWEHMDTWGIAGRNMYWRPVLEFHVAPGGDDRCADFTRLLEGSGFVVKKKQ
jgi:hypothetical protein